MFPSQYNRAEYYLLLLSSVRIPINTNWKNNTYSYIKINIDSNGPHIYCINRETSTDIALIEIESIDNNDDIIYMADDIINHNFENLKKYCRNEIDLSKTFKTEGEICNIHILFSR